eukprot:scaffold65147_cov16-Tisochrysis_lutea.AAC.1
MFFLCPCCCGPSLMQILRVMPQVGVAPLHVLLVPVSRVFCTLADVNAACQTESLGLWLPCLSFLSLPTLSSARRLLWTYWCPLARWCCGPCQAQTCPQCQTSMLRASLLVFLIPAHSFHHMQAAVDTVLKALSPSSCLPVPNRFTHGFPIV